MKIKLLITFILIGGFYSNAQNWQWAESAGGPSSDAGYSISSDSSGNYYITGSFRQTATFGTINITGDVNGYSDIFVAKINSAGQWQWAVRAGGNAVDVSKAIFTDASGNSYITGTFTAAASFGPFNILNLGTNSFIAKIDSSGQWAWAIGVSGAASDITVDNSGNIYITGLINGPSSYGTTTLNSINADVFVAKLDSNKQWIWATSSDGSGYKFGNAITMDNSGNLYVTGEFTDTSFFGQTFLSGGTSVFISKLTAAGQWQWAGQASNYYTPSIANSSGSDIVVDQSGNTYITGKFTGLIVFGSDTIFGHVSIGHAFMAKMDALGQWLWVHQPGGYFIGDRGRGVCKDHFENIYFTGHFNDTVTFGTTTLTNSTVSDLYVAKIDSADQWVWARQAGGCSCFYDLDGRAITVGQNGDVYVTGLFDGTANFGSTLLTGNGYGEIFVAKIGISLGVQENHTIAAFSLSPNPFISFTEIFSINSLNDATLLVYNPHGLLVKRMDNIFGNNIILPRDNLSGGVYFIELQSGDRTLGIRKLIITD